MFKPGYEIICVNNIYRKDLVIGETYIVQELEDCYSCILLKVLGNENYFAHARFELAGADILYPTLKSDYV